MNALALSNFIYGGIAVLSWIVALYFVSFWRRTRDRFFLLFAAAFALLGVCRLAVSASGGRVESHPSIYLIRLFVYLVFLAAIVDKNLRAGRRP